MTIAVVSFSTSYMNQSALEDSTLKHGAEAMAAALARSDGALAVVEQLERLGPS